MVLVVGDVLVNISDRFRFSVCFLEGEVVLWWLGFFFVCKYIVVFVLEVIDVIVVIIKCIR